MAKRKNANTTFIPPVEDANKPTWLLFNAEGKTLGRLASEIAKVLRGKHKPTFTPHMACGDAVIVINADKVVVTGNKEAQKEYFRHTGYPGGLRRTPYRVMMERHPERILESAVWGMLSHNSLGRHLIKRLRVFAGKEHNMHAQKPVEVNI